jgi:hypothetical protein
MPAAEGRQGLMEEYSEVWVCDQPPSDVPYRVVRDEWSEDYTVRRIYEIELRPAEKTPEGA